MSPAILLITTLFLPLLGVGLIWTLAPLGKTPVRVAALLASIATLVSAGCLIAQYPPGGNDYAVTTIPWLKLGDSFQIQFSVGLDGVSLWMFGLSALLTVTAVLVSWKAIEDRPGEFFALLLLLETGMLGVFAARDLMLFYVFFEFTLIPLYFLIGIWGSEDRRYAAVKFFLYTLAGSLLTFLGLLALVLWNARPENAGVLTFSISELSAGLAQHPLPLGGQLAVFLALFAGFAIKVPLFPLHTWLPLAHVQAPTAGSVILAGVLLKIGTYGFVRFSLPMLPQATAMCAPWLLWLSVAGIIYGALVALAQKDMKRLIAYSSVSHLGFCTLGLALNRLGMDGAMLQMINHGLSTGALFAIVGMIYERYHTRQIADLGGLARRLPLLATAMVFFTFSSVGLPGMNGFAGEILLLTGAFQRGWVEPAGPWRLQLQIISLLAVTGVVLGAWYMLWLVQRVFFGPLHEPVWHGEAEGSGGHGHDAHGHAAHGHDSHGHDDHGHGPKHDDLGPGPRDMSGREFFALAPLAVFVLWIGLWPDYFLQRMRGRLDEITKTAATAFDQQQTAQTNK